MKTIIIVLALSLSLNSFAAPTPQLSLRQQGEYGDLIRDAFNKEKNMSVRWKAIMSAAQMAREKATPDLLKAANHSDWFMRTASMIALNEYNPKESQVVAKRLIKDKALVVRSSAVDILAKNMSPEIRAVLWKELNEKYNFKNKYSLWIRPQIVTALAENPQHPEAKLFKGLLKESSLEIQLAAISGLEKLTGMKLGDKKSTPHDIVKAWQEAKVD